MNDVLALFPGGIHALMSLSDEEIRDIINDPYGDFENSKKIQLCLHGTTALVALVDSARENLWIANLGDCQAGTSAYCVVIHVFLSAMKLYIARM